MLKHEAVLLDPSPGEVAGALSEAVAATNRGCRERRLIDSLARWRKFARQALSSAEGWQMWYGGRGIHVPAAHLLGGWWTDAVGRKHVVIRGRQLAEYDDRTWMDPKALGDRPPLWHCYLDRLVRRVDGPLTAWLAVCGCGAVGTSESLAWTGECCGPCHDRAEEYGPDAKPAGPPTRFAGAGGPVHLLTFHQDGSKLAAAGVELAAVWPTGRSADPLLVPLARNGWPFALAFASSDRLCVYQFSGVTVLDLSSEGPVRPRNVGPTDVWGELVGTSCGRLVFATRTSLLVWDVDADRLVAQAEFPSEWGTALFPTPDGTTVLARSHAHTGVLRADTGQLHTLPTSDARRAQGWKVGFPALDVGSGRLFLSGGHLIERCDLASGRVERSRDWPDRTVQFLGFSTHHGRLVAFIDGVLHILDPDTLATVAAFDWHLGVVSAFALSPDGRFAVTAGIEGVVKVWPLDRLVPADRA